MDDKDGLLCAYVLDGVGGGRHIDWHGVENWTRTEGTLWAHLDRLSPRTERWLREQSGLRALQVDALLASETQPRLAFIDDGILLTLRGVNLNPGADPEDMVSLRVWVDASRILTVRMRPLMAISDVRERFASGLGPHSSGEVLSMLATALVRRMSPVIDAMNDEVDQLEDEIVGEKTQDLRSRLRELRHQAISLRRYLAPQRDAVARLNTDIVGWITSEQRLAFRECADQVARIVEDLDAMRERASVIQDELTNRLSERINRNMYLLSVVAALMLPLSVVTGMMGMNVSGIPFAEHPNGFWIVCGLLGVVVTLQVLIFRRLKWI